MYSVRMGWSTALWNAFMRLGVLLLAQEVIISWWQVRKVRQKLDASPANSVPQIPNRSRPRPLVVFRQTLLVAGLVGASLAMVATADYVTGPHLSMAFFYLLPVIIAVAMARLWGGVIAAVCTGAVYLVVKLAEGVRGAVFLGFRVVNGEHTQTQVLWNTASHAAAPGGRLLHVRRHHRLGPGRGRVAVGSGP